MPTILTLDDDLAGLLQAAAQQKGKPATELARTILQAALGKPAQVQPHTGPFRVRPRQQS